MTKMTAEGKATSENVAKVLDKNCELQQIVVFFPALKKFTLQKRQAEGIFFSAQGTNAAPSPL